MYGRPYGKSLCHAWGASPIYLLGKYCLGIQPVKAGYEEFVIRPVLGGLQWMEGKVPTPRGEICLYVNEKLMKVSTGTIEKTGENQYKLLIESKEEVILKYKL